ncbi:MAG: hypothetical protein JWN01_638 [Patescibacteria group bacterium]|nr:hypothetical protein [Patescibacteria group bacterium]
MSEWWQRIAACQVPVARQIEQLHELNAGVWKGAIPKEWFGAALTPPNELETGQIWVVYVEFGTPEDTYDRWRQALEARFPHYFCRLLARQVRLAPTARRYNPGIHLVCLDPRTSPECETFEEVCAEAKGDGTVLAAAEGLCAYALLGDQYAKVVPQANLAGYQATVDARDGNVPFHLLPVVDYDHGLDWTGSNETLRSTPQPHRTFSITPRWAFNKEAHGAPTPVIITP